MSHDCPAQNKMSKSDNLIRLPMKWRGFFNVCSVLFVLGALALVVVLSVEGEPSVQLEDPVIASVESGQNATAISSEAMHAIASLHGLLALDKKRLDGLDIARMNLLCAQDLPGSEGMGIEKELAVLDQWAAWVKSETDRDIHRFYANPANYENSEGYYRILMLITVLQQDFKVRYNPERIYKPDFTDCRDIFVHGLTQGSTDEQYPGGTCVSMPVVYVAVARRLGYPVKLVTTREHVFARWEGKDEQFNIEATGQGLVIHDDEYYKSWPTKLSPEELASGAYLVSLTPSQELGLFMAARGYVLEDTGKPLEATVAYAYSHLLDPLSIDNFDNLGRSVIRRIPEYPAVQKRGRGSGVVRPGKP